jgi:hypothetical protein
MVDHHTKHLAHDIVYKDTQFVEWGIFIAGLSNAKQVASLVAMC